MVRNYHKAEGNKDSGGDNTRLARQDKLIVAALAHVPFDGWSDAALRHAACDCSFPADTPELLFPQGIMDAVDHFTDLADRLMIEDMLTEDQEGRNLQGRIHDAVRLRLLRWTGSREAVRRALLLYAFPANVPRALAVTARTVDAIWRAAGDHSHDFNWYTKRASMAGIYSATLLYWLDDQSDGCEGTWDFLHRSLNGMGRAIRARKSFQDRCAKAARSMPGLSMILSSSRR